MISILKFNGKIGLIVDILFYVTYGLENILKIESGIII